MLSDFCIRLSQNKNILMLFSAAIYVVALSAVLVDKLWLASLGFLIFSLVAIFKNYFPLKYVVVWNLLFYIGVANTFFRLRDVDDLLNLAPINSEISGTIVSIPQGFVEGKPKFFFKVDKIKFNSVEKELKSEKVLVTINSDYEKQNLKIYNSAKMSGRLSSPFKAGNPSQFDYGDYLRNHNAYAVFYANTFELINGEVPLKAKILQNISDYRERVLEIHSKYLKTPYLEILGGIVFGDDAVSPTQSIKQSFVNSGLLHILAASGMNVAFIYGFFFWIFSRFKFNYKLSVLLGMAMVIVYTFMTGLGASIIRAAGMLLFVLVGKLIDRDAHSISLLSFVGLLMLLYNPLYVNDVGFQLSFIVTLGILTMTPLVVRFGKKFLDYIAGIISIPIIAQLWVIPIQIFYFNNISVYSVFANIMSVPILALLSFGGFMSSLLAGITPISDFVCKIFDFILNPLLVLLVNISDFWGRLPNSTIQTSHPSVFQIIVYYLILLFIVGLFYKEIREKYWKSLLISIATALSILLITLLPYKNSDLEITAFDVGNADCFLIKTPKNEYAMIDTGKAGYKGGKSQAKIIVLKYLKDRGIKDLDFLLVTHFDNDHCGGATDVLEDLNVKRLYVNNLNDKSKAAKEIYNVAKRNNTELVTADNKQVIYDKNNLKMTNLLGESSDNDNENSIMTLLEYKDFTMLFTGDVGSAGLTKVLNDIPKHISVLKVPHHGATGVLNKEILEKLAPNYALISVGENRFGHPTAYTLALLQNSKILRTDIDNAIRIKVGKNSYKILTYDIKSRKFKKYK